jgi:hypothetical protein
MAKPVSFFSQTLADETRKGNGSPETTTWRIPVTTLTAANVVAETTLINNLVTAIDAITLGNVLNQDTTFLAQVISSGPATNPLAQRENKYLIRYHDPITLDKFQVSVGTADLSVKTPHSEFVDVTAGLGLAIKIAWELVVVSPDNGSQLTILDSIQFVGRNT